MDHFAVKLHLTPKQIKQIVKGRPTQVKKDQLDGNIQVILDKPNHKRYKRAKKLSSGFRIHATPTMIEGSGFGSILAGLKSGAQKVASVAIPYVKNKLKSLLPGVRSDIDAGINSGVNYVANTVKSAVSPYLGEQITNELVDKGVASVKGVAKNALDGVQTTLNGLGLKRGHHYKMYGGKISMDWGKVGQVLKQGAKVALPVMGEIAGGPLGAIAGVAASELLGSGLVIPKAGPVKLMAKVVAIPKKDPRGIKKKINGAALLPMGKGGALFPL